MTISVESGDKPTTVGLVLGAAVWPEERASPTLERRAKHAVSLYHAGRVTHIVGCGGIGVHPPSEAEVIRRICLSDGVPDCAILSEDRSSNTLDNIRFALPLLRAIRAQNVVIVTDAYHAPRALLAARRLGVSCSGSAPAASGIPIKKQLRCRLREFPAYLWYLVRPIPVR